MDKLTRFLVVITVVTSELRKMTERLLTQLPPSGTATPKRPGPWTR